MTATKPKHDPHYMATLLLWLGFGIAPIAWAVQLQTVYAAAQQTCQGDISIFTLHVVSGVCLLTTALGGLLATWNWMRAARNWPSQDDSGFVARHHFIAAEGMLTSALFTLVIIAQWLAVVNLSPCPL
jgi:hypothetical protein